MTSRDTSLIQFRAYQQPVFADRATGTQVLHWSRQVGKSYTLAAWAVDRCLSRPGRLVTVLSNSKDNGGEFAIKCAEVLRQLDQAFDVCDRDQSLDGDAALRESPVTYEDMRFELRITVGGRVSRIKILAANPRTARGFSGDLILDEFAFHEDSNAIWEAAEPILSSNRDYLCRIASTGNGSRNMFYRLASGGAVNEAGIGVSHSGYALSRVPRSLAYRFGVKIYDVRSRRELTPEEARTLSLDKRAYDQNYECAFADENMALLTHELISAAERDDLGDICSHDWSSAAQDRLLSARGDLYVGVDVGRSRDLTVMAVVERLGSAWACRALLRIEDMRLPDQQKRLGFLCGLKRFRRACVDMTGLGLGLFEYAQDAFGSTRIAGVNFSSTVPITAAIAAEGRKRPTVRVTEAMAVDLLRLFEDRVIRIPQDSQLRDDLRKPEKVTSPGGRVSIAAARDADGHADHFWALALAVTAAQTNTTFSYSSVAVDRERIIRGVLV